MTKEFAGNPVNHDLLEYARERGFEEMHMKIDPKTGLVAVIAIHSTKLGPALGGCRLLEYDNSNDAIYDAMRLARGMSYKNAVANLPLGGGKAVLIRPKHIEDKVAYFTAYAKFVNELQGRYITAVDSGTLISDMDIVNETCPYVASTTAMQGDPSTFTADGVMHGIRAAVKVKLGKDTLAGLRFAIQGVGKVGMNLVKHLTEQGATVTVADVSQENVDKAVVQFGAHAVSIKDIHKVNADIFCPCALGATLNDETIPEIQASIVAGCANNQIAKFHNGQMLHERGILYAPDYVINAGGVIFAYSAYEKESRLDVNDRVRHIYDVLIDIFERAMTENKPTNVVAEEIAEERLFG